MGNSCDIDESRNLILDGDEIRHATCSKRRSSPAIYFLCLILTNIMTSIIAFKAGGVWSDRGIAGLDHMQVPSSVSDIPLYEGVDRDSTHPVQFSAISFQPSPYTAPAGSSVDEAWTALGVEYRTFLVPISEGPAFGITDDHVVVPADAPGAHNQSGYAVDMEAMHQLHCLNLIRKGQFYNHPYYSSPDQLHHRPSWAFRDPEENIKAHINHCIDALRERIMCAADDEVLPYYWKNDKGMTISDFAVSRQCRNFDSLREWAEAHQVDHWDKSYQLSTPKGAYIASDLLSS